MPQRMNPATWVVELISQSMQQQQLQQQAGGEATARTGKTSGSSQSEEVRNDFAALYASSAAAQATMQSANSVKVRSQCLV